MEGQIPGLDKATYKTNEDLIECLKRASNVSGISYLNDVVASSDMFVSNYNLASSIRREYNACACDCESGVCGINKIVKNIDEAIKRVKTIAAPQNTIRLGIETPCGKTGECVSLRKENPELCDGCHGDTRICCNYVVSAQQRHIDRIKVIIIGEEYGY